MLLETAARKVRNDPAIRGLILAIKDGDRIARRVIEDRLVELGVSVPKGYTDYLVAHLCSTDGR